MFASHPTVQVGPHLPKPAARDPIVITASDDRAGDDRSAGCKLRRIVIIEDDQDGAAALRAVLLSAGCDVEVAVTGKGGLALATAFSPDAILLDLALPDIDGFEVAKLVRAQARFGRTRLIAITGYRGMTRAIARGGGFDALLKKPFEASVLLDVLNG